MAARLGDVLYWLGCIVAVIIVIGGTFIIFDSIYRGVDAIGSSMAIGMVAACAATSWAAGRTLKYILAGK